MDNREHQQRELVENDIAPFWAEYAPLRDRADWHLAKYARAFELAHAPRRYSRRLAEMTLVEISALSDEGRTPGSRRRGGHDRDIEGDEGFGYAHDYLAALGQLAGQGHAGDVARVHDAIRRGLSSVPIDGLPPMAGAAASGMLGLVNGGPVATSTAMRAVQRFVERHR